MGGSFDPAHKGHLAISKEAVKRFKLKKIIWAITKKNPFKKKAFFSLKIRKKMCKKLIKNSKKIQLKCYDLMLNRFKPPELRNLDTVIKGTTNDNPYDATNAGPMCEQGNRSPDSVADLNEVNINGKTFQTHSFMPVATRGSINSLPLDYLKKTDGGKLYIKPSCNM